MTNYSGILPTENEWGGLKECSNACCGSVAAASLLCRTNADETAVTVSQRAESDTNTAGGWVLVASEAIRAKSVGACRKLPIHL